MELNPPGRMEGRRRERKAEGRKEAIATDYFRLRNENPMGTSEMAAGVAAIKWIGKEEEERERRIARGSHLARAIWSANQDTVSNGERNFYFFDNLLKGL